MNRISLVLVMLCCHVIVQAQLPVRISIFNESTSMPFSRAFSTPVHPGFDIGTEFQWRNTRHFRLYPTINVGYIFHKHLYQAVFINGGLGVDYKMNFGLNIKTALGVGYMHSFRTQQEYQFRHGQYEKSPDQGNARVTPSFSCGLGYVLHVENQRSPEIFALYQTWIEYPYSPGFIPVMPHTNIHLGYKFYPF